MTLDPDACWNAVRSRDRRFEGRFVLGVRTTRVYCRPGCPARMPRRENVAFFPSPAAAELAGFRACLRCRPDAAPDTPAWNGTSATVARALRLISAGALQDGGLDDLAERLGVGARHLRRLFLEHVGAPPRAISLSRRAHFARQLIERTDWPVSEVARAAGFGSVRRFNECVRRTFGCPPSRLRTGAAARRETGRALCLRLPFKPPFDAAALFSFLAARALPGVESVEGDVYRRAASWPDGSGIVEVRLAPDGRALLLSIDPPSSSGLMQVVARARRLFDLEADPGPIAAHLARDPLLAPLVRRRPGLRVPGAWDAFEQGVRALLGQQISVAAARTLAGHIVGRYGTPLARAAHGVTHLFPSPAALAGADFGAIGLTRARAHALSAFVAAARGGALWAGCASDLDSTVRRLTGHEGIGAWTAHYIAMRALGEPDAFPDGDLGLRKAAAPGALPLSAAELRRRAERWRPWRAYAAVHLWASLG
ncbi:MAG: helix-turn-helix domain-containing protein [Acidobacteria bacterium]|nr:helix-turn-helix domain-containing protein [Acidobacteriota bacterium]